MSSDEANLAEARRILAGMVGVCSFASRRPLKGETCREYMTEMQGRPHPGCDNCQAEEFLQRLAREGDPTLLVNVLAETEVTRAARQLLAAILAASPADLRAAIGELRAAEAEPAVREECGEHLLREVRAHCRLWLADKEDR